MRQVVPVRRGTVLALLGAALVSVGLTVGSLLVRAPAPVVVSAPRPVARTEVTDLTGPACPADAARNVRMSAGWQVVPGGGWTGDGCADRFFYSEPGVANFVQWRFRLDGTARDCRIGVFVPDSPLAAGRVWYGVADRFDNPDYRVGGFDVDQRAQRGKWVDGPTVRIRTGTAMVTVDGGQAGAGVAASAVRVSCAASTARSAPTGRRR